MVSLKEEAIKGQFPDIQAFLKHIGTRYTDEQLVLLTHVASIADEHQEDQTLSKGYDIALVLHALHADYKAVAAALLLPIFTHNDAKLNSLADRFDASVVDIIRGALKMAQFLSYKNPGASSEKSVDGLRKMLTSMINDVRIVLVKLAERLIVLRQINTFPDDAQQLIASEVMTIYSPLANRLGIGQIKWELEDRAFALLHPTRYKEIAKKLDSRRIARESYVEKVMQDINIGLLALDIQAEILGRAKHIYSIWRKMQQKDLDFEKLFDIHALRILVKDVASCYGTLGMLQEEYHALTDEFSDYIATPKANGYQSIHTVLIGPEDKTIEVQIRTHAMNEESEKGVAAHWRYKEGVRRDVSDEARINWLRSLLEWQSGLGDKNDDYQQIAKATVDEQVYVFTPQGDVLDFPKGATPLDFAYRVHSEVGHRCKGAKVQGKMVPLTYALKTGDRVEVITAKTGTPSRDWIRTGSNYLKTDKAKAKVAHWFRQQNKTENTAAGKEIFMKALKRLNIKSVDYDKLMKPYSLIHVDDFFAGIATGDVRINQVLGSLSHKPLSDVENQTSELPLKPQKTQLASKYSGIIVAGEPNMLTHMAKCCKPILGDEVIGFITKGRGVSIHRIDCQYIAQFKKQMPERLINTSWGQGAEYYQADLTITAKNQQAILKELTSLVANEDISIQAMQTNVSQRRQEAIINMTIAVQSVSQLEHLLRLINEKSFVLSVRRD